MKQEKVHHKCECQPCMEGRVNEAYTTTYTEWLWDSIMAQVYQKMAKKARYKFLVTLRFILSNFIRVCFFTGANLRFWVKFIWPALIYASRTLLVLKFKFCLGHHFPDYQVERIYVNFFKHIQMIFFYIDIFLSPIHNKV